MPPKVKKKTFRWPLYYTHDDSSRINDNYLYVIKEFNSGAPVSIWEYYIKNGRSYDPTNTAKPKFIAPGDPDSSGATKPYFFILSKTRLSTAEQGSIKEADCEKIAVKTVTETGGLKAQRINLLTLDLIAVEKIPLGNTKNFSVPSFTIGKIYVPTKWGGKLSIKVTPSSGTANLISLYYNSGNDIDDSMKKKIMTNQSPVATVNNANELNNYVIATDKHGWYFVRVKVSGAADIANTFIQIAETTDRPWNGWYCPIEPNTNPNLYETAATWNFSPLKKYDAKYSTSTRNWEETNHRGTLGWEGHCWGWSLASIAKKSVTAKTGFTQEEMKSFYTELADNGTSGWHWKIGSPSNELPTGPVTDTLGEPIDLWTKIFHDNLRKYILTDDRALNADLRSTFIALKWMKIGGIVQDIPGVALDSGDLDVNALHKVEWNKTASTLTFSGGTPTTVAGDGIYLLLSGSSSLMVTVTVASLPAADKTGYVDASVEVWNHAIFKYEAQFKEEENDNDEKYVEIETEITGNRDTPFPPSATSAVTRKFTYRLTYDGSGKPTTTKQNWINCDNCIPPSCLGIVDDESTFGWHANCGITKARVDAL